MEVVAVVVAAEAVPVKILAEEVAAPQAVTVEVAT